MRNHFGHAFCVDLLNCCWFWSLDGGDSDDDCDGGGGGVGSDASVVRYDGCGVVVGSVARGD